MQNLQENTRGSLFLNKVTGLRPGILFKKGLWHRCFSVNFAKFLRTPFLKKHLWRVPLDWLKTLNPWTLFTSITEIKLITLKEKYPGAYILLVTSSACEKLCYHIWSHYDKSFSRKSCFSDNWRYCHINKLYCA